jgi:hypothetical protein
MLKKVRLEMARNPKFPDGSRNHGYEIVAPLTADGHLDLDAWPKEKAKCSVRRFWQGQDDESGTIERKGKRWVFSYEEGDEDDEPVFRLGDHVFKPGEYISITEHSGEQYTFLVTAVH